MTDSSGDRNPVEILAEEFIARRRGEKPSLSEYSEKYPELARDIRELFPALVMMEELGDAPQDSTGPHAGGVPAVKQLGDYRVLREVGRGGIGVVYEADQESLGRRVALKVLPPHALNDAQHVVRFEREARAAARLHHTNIVPVYGVGQHDGTHATVGGRPAARTAAAARFTRPRKGRISEPISGPNVPGFLGVPLHHGAVPCGLKARGRGGRGGPRARRGPAAVPRGCPPPGCWGRRPGRGRRGARPGG
jgi:hypothetical protein